MIFTLIEFAIILVYALILIKTLPKKPGVIEASR